MNKKPNIIFIFEDHKAYYGHGQLGNGPKIHKPNFERLVSEGIEFTQAYTACPLCGPARRTILTGLYPHSHKEIKNETNAKYRNENYLDKLAEVGYNNYYYGKWHAGKGTALDFNCEGFSVPGYGNPYITPEYEEYIKQYNLPFIEVEVQKNFLDPMSEHLDIKEGESYKPNFPAYSEYITGIMKTPKETHEAFFLADLACKTLKKIANEGNKKPFHLRVDFWGPHPPYFSTQEFLDLYDPKDIPEHPNFRDDLEDKPEFYKFDTSKILKDHKKSGEDNPIPWSEWQKVLAINYAEQTLIDEAAGLILNTVEELGLKENTVIIWAADHGDAVACHGGHFDKDSYMPQEMIKIPQIIRWPEKIEGNRRCDKFVSNLDYAPTFLDIAGTSFTNGVEGRSLLPLLIDEETDWREDIVIETQGHFINLVARVIIYDHYKYIWNENYIDELYDLEKDPFELNNLIEDQDYQVILREMKLRLQDWREKTNDNISLKDIRGKKLRSK